MKFLLKLEKTNIKLSQYEIETVLNIKILGEKTEIEIETNTEEIKKLSLAKKIYHKEGRQKKELKFNKWENINSRPGFHPISLKPKLARTLVNISGAKKEILDPFCGTGGILIEAGKIGLKIKGFDIDLKMIELTQKNLKFYNLKGKIQQKNSLTINNKEDYIITDMPYGKNTKQKNYEEIIQKFLDLLPKILGKKAIIVIPNNIKINIPTGLELEKEFFYYVHKSMTKRILVIKK